MQPTSVLGRARCRVREESAPEAATRSPSTARLARVIAEEVVRVHRGSKGDNSALPSGRHSQPIAATGSGEPPGMSPSGTRRPRRRGAATISIVNPEHGGGDRHARREGSARLVTEHSRRAAWLRQARSYLRNADPVLARLIDDRPDFDFAQARLDNPFGLVLPTDLFGALLSETTGRPTSPPTRRSSPSRPNGALTAASRPATC